MSTWTPSSSRSSSCGGRSCRGGRWSSAALATAGCRRRGVLRGSSLRRALRLPSTIARRRCPDAVFLPGDHARYEEVSRRLQDDLPALHATGRAHLPGRGVPGRHRLRCGCSAPAPLSPPRIRRDVDGGDRRSAAASGWRRRSCWPSWPRKRPSRRCSASRASTGSRAWWWCRPATELAFLHPLPVSALWGVGPATRARLERLGRRHRRRAGRAPAAVARGGPRLRRTVGTCTTWPTASTTGRWSRTGSVKSVGHEETFAHDLDGPRRAARGAGAAGGRRGVPPTGAVRGRRHAPSPSRSATATSPR